MKVEELLEMMDIYQDFQLVNAKTGESHTPVTYMADASDEVTCHKNDIVHGISAGISTDDGAPYVKILIDIVL